MDGQSFTDLPEDMKGIIVKEKEPITIAEADEKDARSTTDIPTTMPSSATELQENAGLTEKVISKNSSKLKSNSTRQLEVPIDTENNTVEDLTGQVSESEKQSSIDKKSINQLEGKRTSGGAAQLSDEIQLLQSMNGSKVAKNLSSDGKEDELNVGPDSSIRENLGSAMEDDEAGFKADVISQEKGIHEKKDEVKLCDYTVGKWVLDKTRPLYSGRECTMWLSPDWACRLHNHPDKRMDRYRWQPVGCNLPVFNASAALET